MGRQGGIARFLGTSRQMVGYVDDGRALWRKASSLTKKKWLTMPSMAPQREAAKYFRAATVVAGAMWSLLPREMRRLADGGGFNRMVGACRKLVEEDGRLWGLDSLAGLDLSVDSMGPLRVVGSVGDGWRLTGVKELMSQINEGVGYRTGRTSEKYVVGQRFVDDGTTRETVDREQLGECRHWRGKWKVKNEKGTVIGEPHVGRATRRVRVWVHACEVADTEWDENGGIYDVVWHSLQRNGGFVSDWLVIGEREVAAQDYKIDGIDFRLPRFHPDGTGIFVVFTAVEVAEKRGRHWVRLPWCSSMQVSEEWKVR